MNHVRAFVNRIVTLAIFLEEVARLGLISVPCLRHCHPGRASSFFRPFLRSAGGDGLHSLHGIENCMVFFSRLPRSLLGSLAFAVLTCFLLVGMVASTCGGIRGCFSVDCFVR